MEQSLKEYLNIIEKEHKEYYLLFSKFYLSPSQSLGGSEEKTLSNYYEYGDIKKLIINQDFYPFLKQCMREDSFNKKLDYNLLKKIRFMLLDIYELKEKYYIDLENKAFRDICQNKISIVPNYNQKYSKLEINLLKEHYKRFGWLYEVGINKDFLNKLDRVLLETLIKINDWQIEHYYKLYLKPTEDKKNLLRLIRIDDYSNFSCFLLNRNGHDKKVFDYLVCENEFLTIIKNDLLTKELPIPVINNIINILETGIIFKTNKKDNFPNFAHFYHLLGPEKIKTFDLKTAKELIVLLEKKKANSKIIKFPTKKRTKRNEMNDEK